MLYVIEPESPELNDPVDRTAPALVDAHSMNPMRVLDMAREMGSLPTKVVVVGCEPATLGDEIEGAMGLSAPVEAAVSGAIAMVEWLVSRMTEELQAGAPA